MVNVIIYTKQTCPFCVAAKNLLDDKGIKYETRDIEKNPQYKKDLDERNRKTVPQIVVDTIWLGGYTDIQDLDEQGKLDEILGL